MADWPKLGSPEDANATHRWARECLEMWEAERKVYRLALLRIRDELEYRGDDALAAIANEALGVADD